MGYAVSGAYFDLAAKALKEHGYPEGTLHGVYVYDGGTIHCVTSENDDAPRIVLRDNGKTRIVDHDLTQAYNDKRAAYRLEEEGRKKAAAEWLDKRTAKVMYDVDEAEVILGDNISIKNFSDPLEVVRYLNGIGVRVEYTDADAGETRIYEPTL